MAMDAAFGVHAGRRGPAGRLKAALSISIILHVAVLFAVSFKLPRLEIDSVTGPLEVVLAGSRPEPESVSATASLRPRASRRDSASDTAGAVVGSTPPSVESVPAAVEAADPAGQEAAPAAAAPEEDPAAERGMDADPDTLAPDRFGLSAGDLVQRGLEIARMQARAGREHEIQRPPRHRFVSARTREYRFVRYIEDWRLKVERIGNLNYPEAARREGLHGSLQLTVGIRSDGALESIELNRSSGERVLDEAAVRIVKLAGQNGFAPFPPDIGRDTDVLYITRFWVFTRADELTSQ